METSKQELRRKQEEAELNKLLIWIGVAIGYEAIALLLKRFYINFKTAAEVDFAYALSKVFSVLQYAGPVIMIGCLVWFYVGRKNGKSSRAPLICAGVSFAVSFTAILSYRFFDSGVHLLGAVAPVTAVLALVYYLYQKEFFCNTVLTGGGIFSLWMYRRFFLNHPNRIIIGFVLGWIVLIAAVVLAARLSKRKGKWKGKQLFSVKASYLPTYITCGITAAAMLAALVLGSSVAYYAIFALVTWLFCLAVYYTVRLM